MQRNENQALLIWDHGVLMREKVHWCRHTAHPICTVLIHRWREPRAMLHLPAADAGLQPVDQLFCVGLQVIYWDCLESRALPQFVREQLIRLHRVTGRCLYAACDIVIPCNATFNTKWEVRCSFYPLSLHEQVCTCVRVVRRQPGMLPFSVVCASVAASVTAEAPSS